MNVNKVLLGGRLGQDVELRHTQNGVPCCTLSIATSTNWTDKGSKEKKQITYWHKVVCWNHEAVAADHYLKKGDPVFIEGEIQNRKWVDKDGTQRFSTEILCRNLQLINKRPGENSEQKSLERQYEEQEDYVFTPTKKPEHVQEDIPF